MTGKKPRQFVSFDWAMKKLLRSKANFDVLEGFLSELLNEDITIENILESESDRETKDNKLTRVDLMVHDSLDQQIIIEVQYEREADYFQRMLYGTAKTLSDNLDKGRPYGDILQVISVNIVFFDLGQGDDYVYIGKTGFTGMHLQDSLALSDYQKDLFPVKEISDIFPVYYILKINSFGDIAKDGLDEWIYFLKNEEIKPGSKARGLEAAQEKLSIMKLSDGERAEYERYQEELHLSASLMEYSVKELERRKKELEETQTLLLSERERAELAQKREEEERRQKEDAVSKLEAAVETLVAAGISREQARKQLGLD
jgi:predicted transposase/invertase (TIGR01784 family)